MIKIKVNGLFDGVNTKKDGISEIKFRFPFNEIANYSALIMLINEQCQCMIEAESHKYTIPEAKFKMLKIDRDGEAVFAVETFCNNITGLDAINLVQKSICLKIIGGKNNP